MSNWANCGEVRLLSKNRWDDYEEAIRLRLFYASGHNYANALSILALMNPQNPEQSKIEKTVKRYKNFL